MATGYQSLLTHDDPYYVRFFETSGFESEKERIWKFILKELEAQYKSRPYDDNIFRFFLFVKQNKILVLSQIRKEFPIKHPPVAISVSNQNSKDTISEQIATMPYPVFEKIKTYHRIGRAFENRVLVKEIQLLARLSQPDQPYGFQYTPSQIRAVTRPHAGSRKKIYRYPHPDPLIRLAMRAVERMKNEFLRQHSFLFQRY